MSRLQIAMPSRRKALLIPRGMSKDNPGFLFPLQGMDPGELDELIRAILAKGGVTNEAEVQAVVEAAEQDMDTRIKVAEARAELKRLMAKRARGEVLMQRGFRHWVQAIFPATKRFKKELT